MLEAIVPVFLQKNDLLPELHLVGQAFEEVVGVEGADQSAQPENQVVAGLPAAVGDQRVSGLQRHHLRLVEQAELSNKTLKLEEKKDDLRE